MADYITTALWLLACAAFAIWSAVSPLAALPAADPNPLNAPPAMPPAMVEPA